MRTIINKTQRNFVFIIFSALVCVVLLSWLTMYYYSTHQLASPADALQVHNAAKSSEELTAYLEEQKDFEAHFVTLASEIKKQESDRTNQALMTTSLITLGAGGLLSFIAARRLVRPVHDAYASQERFLQDAAHELRNPLAAMSATLQQAKSTPQTKKLITVFERQTKRLVAINEDLLFLERTSEKKIGKENISELLQDVIEELQPLAAARSITIELAQGKIPERQISRDDYIRLAKNLIENAIKYSADGQKVVIKQTSNKDTITLSVKDSGIGIPEDEIDKIESRFFRASNTQSVHGTGLGLSIVRKILNIYGGDLAVESKVGKGSTFTASF